MTPESTVEVPTAEELDSRSARLCEVYDPDHFSREATGVVAVLRNHLWQAASGARPVWPAVPPEELLEAWPDPEEECQDDLPGLLADVVAGSTCQHHPGFVGQQLAVPPPTLGLVAMVSAVLNNSAAIYEGAPIAVALERRVISWMARVVGFGAGSGGVLTSGGTLGALTALLAARQAKVGDDSWGEGLTGAGRNVVFVSEEAHYCHRRACAVLGLGDRGVIPVPTDERFRMNLDSLRALHQRARDEGLHPMAVVGTAASTSTGSYDPLPALADFCQEHGLWFHVDAAHGGAALLSPALAPRLDGIERADSVVWDAHKMMMTPSLCTAVLFRDGQTLDAAFRQEASYLLSDETAPWHQPAARNFETTKPTMVLPLYLALRTLGREFMAEYVAYAYGLARAFAKEIEEREGFELLVHPESNIVCFRLTAQGGEGDALQLRRRDAVNRRGRFFLMRTVLRGKEWLRVVLMNPATRPAHLRELLDELSEPPEAE